MATLPNAQLYDFGPYPGIGRDGTSTGSVRGEVFEISDDALAAADLVEGHPDFYERRLETVTLDDGTTDEAWAYWAPVALLSEAVLIDSGDWFDRVHSHDGSSIDEHLETAKSTLIDGAES